MGELGDALLAGRGVKAKRERLRCASERQLLRVVNLREHFPHDADDVGEMIEFAIGQLLNEANRLEIGKTVSK